MSTQPMSEIVRRVWEGSIAVRIRLAAADALEENPPRFYALMKRNSYFHTAIPTMLQFFQRYIRDQDVLAKEDWWLEFEDVPVKWNWPVGLVFDVLTGYNPEDSDTLEPLELTLHHTAYPAEYIVPIFTSQEKLRFLEDYWTNQVKEACYVMNGSTKPIMNLSKNLSADLWRSVLTSDMNLFISIFRRLIPKPVMHQVPLRVYLPVSNNVLQPIVSPTNSKTKSPTTLGEALQKSIPELFPTSLMYTIAYPICHGIVIPMGAPLAELYELMMYLDGFLHVSVVLIKKD